MRRAMAPIPPPLFGGARSRGRNPIYVNERALAMGDDTELAFNPSVEAWRSDIESGAGDLPVNFLLMWVQVESNGNPCNYTSLHESGIFQLMAPDNLARGNTTEAQQHPVPPCIAGTNSTKYRSSLSDQQAGWQVDGGVTYVNYCRDYARMMLKQYGYDWSENDWSFWAMVKMVHVAPAPIPRMLQAGIDGNGGSPPDDWDAMAKYVTGVPQNWLDNARKVGLAGQGGGSVFNKQTMTYAIIGGGAILLYMMARRHARRAGRTFAI